MKTLPPVEPHLSALRPFGLTVKTTDGSYNASVNRAVEAKVHELGGHKSLYSEAFYDADTFAGLYGTATSRKGWTFPELMVNKGRNDGWVKDVMVGGIDVAGHVVASTDPRFREGDPVRAVAFTVMPGPQLVSAVALFQIGEDGEAETIEIPGTRTVTGGSYPARIWGQFNTDYHADREPVEFTAPEKTRPGRPLRTTIDSNDRHSAAAPRIDVAAPRVISDTLDSPAQGPGAPVDKSPGQ